jgi:hypothetical protein
MFFFIFKKYNINRYDIMFYLVDNLIYYKSIFDIKYKLYRKKLLVYIKDMGGLKDNNDVFFIKDGEYLFISNRHLLTNLDISENDQSILNYDFILYKIFDIDKDIVNHVILHSRNKYFNMINTQDYNLDYSEVNFLLIELIFTDNFRLKIDFKTPNYNFYIVNNIINKDVIKYILNFYYKKSLDAKYLNDAFEVSILDDVANEFDLNSKSIVICKSDYKLIG